MARDMSSTEYARLYMSLGAAPIPVPFKSKNPNEKGWQKIRLSEDDIDRVFGRRVNIGLLVGDPSTGLIDVDLDAPDAIVAADVLLPYTPMVHGRKGKPRSHRWYRVRENGLKTKKFKVPTSTGEAMLLELRSTGCQTIVPPSVHSSGEPIEWSGPSIAPTEIDGHLLEGVCGDIAAAVQIAREWPGAGARHEAAMALAGWLLRNGRTTDDCERIVEAVARAAGDPEVADRVACVATTAARLAAGDTSTGFARLVDLVDQRALQRVRTWLGFADPAVAEAREALDAVSNVTPIRPEILPTSAPTGLRFPAYPADEFIDRPPPAWLIPGLVVANSLTMIVAPPATFKTFLALDIALSIANGTPWAGIEVESGLTLYIAAEGAGGMASRIRAWQMARGGSLGGLYVVPSAPNLWDGDVGALLDTIASLPFPPAVVFVDTLARTTTGADENSSRDMGLFIAACDQMRRACGATVVIVHHPGKNSGNMRGSSALLGALDTLIELKRDGDRVVLTVAKQKDASEIEPLAFRRRVIDLGGGVSSMVLDHVAEAPRNRDVMPELHERLADVLWRFFGEEGATLARWRDAALAEKVCERATFYRATQDMQRDGLVQMDDRRAGGRAILSDRARKFLAQQEAREVVSPSHGRLTASQRQAETVVSSSHVVSPPLGGETVRRDETALNSDGAPVWGCPHCAVRSWAPSGDRWACRLCGTTWTTQRAIGDAVYPTNADGVRIGSLARITEIAERPSGRWCALEGSDGRCLEEQCEPAAVEESED